jgi:polysaccharide export outer membrane protein
MRPEGFPRRAAAALLLATTVAGCSGPAKPVTPPPAPTATPTPAPQVGAVLPPWESVDESRSKEPPVYRLFAGDVLEISVVGHDDMKKELPVRPDGRIAYYLGDVQAAGLTVAELRLALEEDLKRQLRYPQVSVILRKARDPMFSIVGKVVRPGVYPLTGGVTVVQAIALAQGFSTGQYEGSTVEIADLKNSFLVRRNRVVPIDFEQLVRRGDTRQDVALEDGDYIYVPSALQQEVYILGEVFKPRSFGVRGRVTLLQAISESGGFRPEARLGTIAILRGVYGKKQVIPISVKEIVAGNVEDPDLVVGDVVYVRRQPLATLAQWLNQMLPALLALQLARNL